MVDRVCGRVIDPERSKFQETYQGVDYFFCSMACQQAFLKNPDRHRPWRPGKPDRRKPALPPEA